MKDEISLAGDSRLEEVGRLCHPDLIGCRRQPSEVYLCGRQRMSKCIHVLVMKSLRQNALSRGVGDQNSGPVSYKIPAKKSTSHRAPLSAMRSNEQVQRRAKC